VQIRVTEKRSTIHPQSGERLFKPQIRWQTVD
jgi:hypothetical protein